MQIELFLDIAGILLAERFARLGKSTEEMPRSVLEQAEIDLATRIRDYVLRRLLESMDEKDLDALDTALDTDDEEAATAILEPYQSLMAKILEEFATQYLEKA